MLAEQVTDGSYGIAQMGTGFYGRAKYLRTTLTYQMIVFSR